MMRMSFTELERQALGSIADGLAGSDPRLTSMLTIFSRLAVGEEMPVREKIRVRRGRPAAHRPRRTRRYPRRYIAFPPARRLHARPGWQQACWCWGPSSPPHCSPPRWSSTPAATRPAPGRWERRAPRPPSRSMSARADADALRAEMIRAPQSWPARWSPGCGRSARVQGRRLTGWPCRCASRSLGWCVAPPAAVRDRHGRRAGLARPQHGTWLVV